MALTYLLLGSNIGNRTEWIEKGITAIITKIGEIVAISAIYETEAWGLKEQPDFLNVVIAVKTDIIPEELLAVIIQIEHSLERQREIKWGERTLDIDILFYDDLIVQKDNLKIPHPHLHERLFTLLPLAEIAPGLKHPVTGKTITDLLNETHDKLEVRKKGEIHLEKLKT
jgi:2-amino-4-hydroxy-6-hydroxymethyldihydropteridine diphosphokinase